MTKSLLPSSRSLSEQIAAEVVNELSGAHGDRLKQAVRWEDLLGSGLADIGQNGALVRSSALAEDIRRSLFGIEGSVSGVTEGFRRLESTVSQVDGRLRLQTEDLTALRTQLEVVGAQTGGLQRRVAAESVATHLLLSRITAGENYLEVLSRESSKMAASVALTDAELSWATGNVIATASAQQELTARVEVTEDNILAHSQFITDLQASVSVLPTVYLQPDMPVGGSYVVGDMWLDSNDGNKVHVWDGMIWGEAVDLVGATVYAQPEPPGPGQLRVGDMWFDTDNGYLQHRWDGTKWVDVTDPRIAAAAAATQDLYSKVELTNNSLSAVAGDVTSLKTSVYDGATGLTSKASNTRVDTAFSRLDNAGGTGVTVESVATSAQALEAKVNNPTTGLAAAHSAVTSLATTTATATDAVAEDVSNLTASTKLALNPVANLINNPSGQVGTAGWVGGALEVVELAGQEKFFRLPVQTVAATSVRQWRLSGAIPGEWYTFSVEGFVNSSVNGEIYIDMLFIGSTGATIADAPNVVITPGAWGRFSVSYPAPAGTTAIDARFVVSNASWSGSVAYRRAKLERSARMTPYDNEALLNAAQTSAAGAAAATAAMTARVNNVGGGKSIEAVASDVVSLTAEVEGKASATALQALDTQVNHAATGLATKASGAALTQVSARLDAVGNPNLIPNPTGAVGFDGWSFIGGAQQSMHVRTELYGHVGYMYAANAANVAIDQGISRVEPQYLSGQPVTASVDMFASGMVSGGVYVQLRFQDAAGVEIDPNNRPQVNATNGTAMQRYTVSGTAPAGTAKFSTILRVTGTLNGHVAWRNLKVERGSIATPFTDDRTTAQQASVTQAMRADVDSVTGKVNTSYTLAMNANGKFSGVKYGNDGTISNAEFLFDNFDFITADGSFQITGGRTITRSGGYMRVEGKPFGQNNEMVVWYGPNQTNLADCRRNNAISYETNNGLHYAKGAMFSGTITAGGQTLALGAVTFTTGQFGSNGGPIVINASFSHSRTQRAGKAGSGQKNSIATGTGTTQASIELWRSLGGGAFALVASTSRVGTLSINASGDPDVEDFATWNNTVSLTYTDNVGGTALRDYQIRVVAETYQNVVISGGYAVPPPTNARALGVLSSE